MLIKDKDFFKAIYVFLLINQMLVEIWELKPIIWALWSFVKSRVNKSQSNLYSVVWFLLYAHDYIIQ